MNKLKYLIFISLFIFSSALPYDEEIHIVDGKEYIEVATEWETVAVWGDTLKELSHESLQDIYSRLRRDQNGRLHTHIIIGFRVKDSFLMPKDQYDQMNEGLGSLFSSSIKSSSQDNQGSNENPLFKSPGGASPSITFQKGPLSFSFGIGAPSSGTSYDTPEGAAQRTAQIEAELKAKDKATMNQLQADWKRIHSNFTQAFENLNTNLKSTSEELVNAATRIEHVNIALPSSIQKYNDALRAEDLAPPHPFLEALKTGLTSEERKSIVDLLSEIDLARQKAGPREPSLTLFFYFSLDHVLLSQFKLSNTFLKWR